MSPVGQDPPPLIVLGGLGDLALRHLLPALSRLEHATGGQLVQSVLCVDQADADVGALRSRAADLLALQSAAVPAELRGSLVSRLGLRQVDLSAPAERLLAPSGGAGAVVYCALPGPVLPDAVAWLAVQRLPAGTRLAIEKPFGYGRASARQLTDSLERRLLGVEVYRVDHVLHHQFARALVARRTADPGEWDHRTVSRVELSWEETVAVPTARARFYDQTGALRDMLQSHLLQLLALVAMDPSAAPEELAVAKARVLARVLAPTPDQLRHSSVRGRYTSGTTDGQLVPAYADLVGVDPSRCTETFASVRLHLDDERWRGVPFDLSAGKAFGRARKGVTVHRTGGLAPLRFAFDGPPDDEAWLPPSSLILQDLLSEEPRWAVSAHEVDECWRVADAVLAGWAELALPLVDYAAGSAGHASTRRGHRED